MSKTSETVWVSDAMTDTRLAKSFTADVSINDLSFAVELQNKNSAGKPLPAEHLPNEFYHKYRDKKAKKLPDFFIAGGFNCVSATFADVLRQFDLGAGALVPTKLFQHDRTTLVEGEYFCLNFGNRKQAFVPEYSPKANKPYPKHDIWTLPSVLENNDIAFTKMALDGPDLWVDLWVQYSMFLSNPLVQALKAVKLTRRFGLRKCRVIREN